MGFLRLPGNRAGLRDLDADRGRLPPGRVLRRDLDVPLAYVPRLEQEESRVADRSRFHLSQYDPDRRTTRLERVQGWLPWRALAGVATAPPVHLARDRLRKGCTIFFVGANRLDIPVGRVDAMRRCERSRHKRNEERHRASELPGRQEEGDYGDQRSERQTRSP